MDGLDEEEFLQSIELLAPLVPALKTKEMDSEADRLEVELFKAIFRAHIHVPALDVRRSLQEAYPNASKTEVDCANFLFDALRKYGPGQVWKDEGVVHAFAMIPYQVIQQAFTLVAGKL